MNQILKKDFLEMFFSIFRAKNERADPLCRLETTVETKIVVRPNARALCSVIFQKVTQGKSAILKKN